MVIFFILIFANMKLKYRIKKWWLELPRFKINFKFNIEKYYYDKRAFEWYLQNEIYGFTEVELWSLGFNFDNRLRKKYNYPLNESRLLSPEIYSELFKKPEFTEDAIWLYNRVKFYIEYDCPFSHYEANKHALISQEEIKHIFDKLLLILKHRSEGGNVLDAEVNYVYKYLADFGW